MKMLLSTTALVVTLGFPVVSLAQQAGSATIAQTQQQGNEMSGFLSKRGETDIHASELIGHEVHAGRDAADAGAAGQDTAAGGMSGAKSLRIYRDSDSMMSMDKSDLDDMDMIGRITDVVLSEDGQVRALVIGVGGFLGMGAHNVAVTMQHVRFISDTDDASEMHIVTTVDEEQLESAPAYGRSAMKGDTAERDTNDATNGAAQGPYARADQDDMALTAPDVTRYGYERVDGNDVSTEMLMGKTVYDLNENDVGTVTDSIIDDDGNRTEIIVDFGGFLGMGSSQVAISFDELTFLMQDDDIRLYVDATKKQIQNRQKRASN